MNQQPPTGMMDHPPPPPTTGAADNPVIVIAPQYCTPNQVDLQIAKKVAFQTVDNNLGAFDINGNMIFKVENFYDRVTKSSGYNGWRMSRILVDVARGPDTIVSLKPKKYSSGRWNAYRGYSTNAKDLLFSVKRSKCLQFKTNLDVFLASNATESVCDFKIKQSYNHKSCVIYRGRSKSIIAEMHKQRTVRGGVFGNDTFSVTVHPNVDYAFVIALRVVLDEINTGGGGRDEVREDSGYVVGAGCGG
ncbi:hypothetical protein MKW94_003623 [Papaver nudicaule]|uniref:Uncharacterized protein n=1 Tax=Papaver nudicaule TaxID=74823 RepID=A0AA42AVR5_PAPNU|nr:hypothetical protein [Papaver nudicaule]